MGKAPAFQFYPGDWTRDLDDQELEVEGAWIRICCRLWWSETKGQATKPMREWARILRKSEKKTREILEILIAKGISSGSVLDNQSVTIISRRMIRDAEISELRKRVGKLGGNPALQKQQINLDNQTSNQNPTPSSSSSSSKEDTLSTLDQVDPPNGNGRVPYSEIRKLFIEILPELPRPREENTTWHKECRARWLSYPKANEEGLDWCRRFFHKIRDNPHWLGENERGWKPTIGWFWKSSNFWKVIER